MVRELKARIYQILSRTLYPIRGPLSWKACEKESKAFVYYQAMARRKPSKLH